MLLHCVFFQVCVFCAEVIMRWLCDCALVCHWRLHVLMKRGCVSGFYTKLPICIFSPFPLDTHTHFYHQNASHNALRRIFTDKKWRLEKKIRWCVKTVGLWTTPRYCCGLMVARLLCGHHHKLGKEPATTKTGFIFDFLYQLYLV